IRMGGRLRAPGARRWDRLGASAVCRRRKGSMDATQLKRIPIFEDVPDEDLTVITTFASSDEAPEGAVIVKEGDYANAFMAIEEGTAKVTREGQQVGELGPGDIFGEIGLLEK